MIKKLEEDLDKLLTEVKAYNTKPKKAISKRIRLGLGELKKDTATLRAKLIELDKQGY
jgi:hypothetical protein